MRQLGWEEFVLVLPDADPLLARQTIDLRRLADRRWVHFAPTHGLADVVDLCCAHAGFTPRVAVAPARWPPPRDSPRRASARRLSRSTSSRTRSRT